MQLKIQSTFSVSSTNPEEFFLIPEAIDSGEYIPCNDEICPFIDESDFSAQIFKDIATVSDLTSEGTSSKS